MYIFNEVDSGENVYIFNEVDSGKKKELVVKMCIFLIKLIVVKKRICKKQFRKINLYFYDKR